MSSSAILFSEVAYHAAVTVDCLTQLDSLYRQMNHLKSAKQIEEERTIEAKANRIIHERLPKLLRQLWDELCSSIKSFILLPSTSNGRSEECKRDLVYYCVQFAYFRSVFWFTISLLSRRTQNDDGSALDSSSWPRCIAQLLREKESPRSSNAHSSFHCMQKEKHQHEEWLMDFMDKLLHVAELCATSDAAPLFGPLDDSLAAAKAKLQENSPQAPAQPQSSEDPRDVDMYREQLKLFKAACLEVADELLTFLRDAVKEHFPCGVQQEELKKSECDEDSSMVTPVTSQWGSKTGMEISLSETAAPEPQSERVCVRNSLSSGEDRWVFFRIYPDNHPLLTSDEVAAQVRDFYEIYNRKKAVLAESLAEGFGEDYSDLFDALEHRYCFASQDEFQNDVNSPIHRATEMERNGRQLEETNSEDLNVAVQPEGCAIM